MPFLTGEIHHSSFLCAFHGRINETQRNQMVAEVGFSLPLDPVALAESWATHPLRTEMIKQWKQPVKAVFQLLARRGLKLRHFSVVSTNVNERMEDRMISLAVEQIRFAEM